MRRLVCIVEGRGDVAAMPVLCDRIRRYLDVADWCVDADSVRQPRSRLVDCSVRGPRRLPNHDGLMRALRVARQRGDAALIACDADDDCAATWGPAAAAAAGQLMPASAIMIVNEYETWILHCLDDVPGLSPRIIERRRGAKEL